MAAAAADLEARGAAVVTAAPAAPAAAVFPTAEERVARRAGSNTGAWLLRIAAVLVIALPREARGRALPREARRG